MTEPSPKTSAAMTRRAALKGGAALAAAAAFGPLACAAPMGGRVGDDPFSLGVASGDPLSDRVVIWTRLAPRPLQEDGGMGREPVPVRWQLAHDEGFTRIAREGAALARPEHAHCVHVDVEGLAPRRGYFYRFIAGGAASPVGRTRTAPAPGAGDGILRLGQVGCQHYEHGYFTAYRHLAGEELDLVLHTGDYIYEGAGVPAAERKKRREIVRHHPPHVCATLAQYRLRYALYKSDADLRAAHAAHPFAIVFDDHELANNWAGDQDQHGRGGDAFMARRAAALKAWWEHMPLRSAPPKGAHLVAYRGLEFGRLARFSLCDTRQYRTLQPCGGKTVPICDGVMNERAQMLGAEQEAWLARRFAASPARWNVMGQQVLMAELDRDPDPAVRRFDMDKWEAYRIPRRRLLSLLQTAKPANPVVLTGDLHHHIAADLRLDFTRPETPVLAGEFVNTSISSGGDGVAQNRRLAAWRADNPHLKFVSGLRGYVRHTVTDRSWRADFRVLDRVTRPGAPVRTQASFAIAAGRPGVAVA